MANRIIAVDPGVTTGVSIVEYGDDYVDLVDTYQVGDPDVFWMHLREAIDKQRAQGHEVVAVIEQFDKRPGIVNPDYTPKYINRDIENNITDVEIVWQIPALAMNLVKTGSRSRPDALKKYGWYRKSNTHGNDATRHAVAYLVQNLHHRPTQLIGWPKQKDD